MPARRHGEKDRSPTAGAAKPHHLDDGMATVGVSQTLEEVQSLQERHRPHPVASFR